MKVAFHTLGCKTNAYETQAIKEQFERAGFKAAEFSGWADVYIINTCSVTAVAAQKSRQMLHRCKKNNPDALVVACGCYAQEAAKELSESGVDLVVGNNEKSKILDLVLEKLDKERGTFQKADPKSGDDTEAEPSDISKESIVIDDMTHCVRYEEQTITNAGSHIRAYVKIQDGCNRFCSYCIIPYLRGRSRSRDIADILNEVKTLSESGIKEIVLTGIDISDFSQLAELVLEIEKVEGIERIRLGSLEAGIITEDFLSQIKDSKKLCPHFHLSLQSGCDETLKRMNRDYSAAEFKTTVERLRAIFENPAITTDVIAGFAGETEEEFAETKQFVKDIAFSEMHVFPYSRRKGTRADKMPGQLTKAQKAERAAELIRIGKEMQLDYMTKYLGREVPILSEEIVKIGGKDHLIGFTPEYIKAAVRWDRQEVNKIVTICPDAVTEYKREQILIQTERHT